MTITNSEVTINRNNGSELKRRIKDVHTPHVGKPKPYNRDVTFNASGNVVDSNDNVLFDDLDAYVADHAIQAQDSFAAQEIQQWEADMRAGLDPAHIDMGGWFEHSVPEYNTWEDALDGSMTPILQATYMQDILLCELPCSRLTKQELEAVAGKNNDVLSEQAIARNTQNELDVYVPLIDENGEPRP